jgi:hypothetical protein
LQEIDSLVEDLTNSIDFVDRLDTNLKPDAYRALYEKISLNNQTNVPQMLLLQRRIDLLKDPGTNLNETKKNLDADCRKIISRIVKGIGQKDYSISRYITKKLDDAVLNDNMVKIVREFYNGTLENTLLLIAYSNGLSSSSNACFLINALLKELEKRQLLESVDAMNLWAHARFAGEEENWSNLEACTQKLCTDAIVKLDLYKETLYGHYKKYVENSDKHTIQDLHKSNWHLRSIVRDFVYWYYNGEVDRTQNLLAASNAIQDYVAVGRILSQLHEEMAESDQLNSFGAFKLFNQVQRYMNSSNFNSQEPEYVQTMEQLIDQAPAWVLQLPARKSKFLLRKIYYFCSKTHFRIFPTTVNTFYLGLYHN